MQCINLKILHMSGLIIYIPILYLDIIPFIYLKLLCY